MAAEINDIAASFTNDCRQAFEGQLISVILYGSALTSEYIPKKSDLNFLVGLSEKGMEQLEIVHGYTKKWQKEKIGVPLFLTKTYIESSLDSFPVEFINIRSRYKVFFGEDLLTGLSFKKDFIRLQCERELKGKLLLLREGYVRTEGKAGALTDLITGSIGTFVFLFNGLLFLLDRQVPETKRETIRQIAPVFQIDETLFLSLLEMKNKPPKLSKSELTTLFHRYLAQVEHLCIAVDRTEV